jgi:hypothetical protein
VGLTLRALLAPLQWRVLFLWWLVLSTGAAMVVIPAWLALGKQLNHSLLAAPLVKGLEVTALVEAFTAAHRDGWRVGTPLVMAFSAMWLAAPWLWGLVVDAARRPRPLRSWGALVDAGFAGYGRMFRLQCLAGALLLAVMALNRVMGQAADDYAARQILEAEAERMHLWVWLVSFLLLWLVQWSVDAARARFVLEPWRESVLAAWWQGLKHSVKVPGVWAVYLVVSATGGILLWWVAMWRLETLVGAGLGALCASQALMLSWIVARWARLHALVQTERAHQRGR